MIAAWLVVGGIVRIVAAVKLRDFSKRTGVSVAGASWGMLLVMGVVVALLGVLCLVNPLSVMAGVGFMLGIAIICVGVDLIARGIRM